MSTSIRLAKLEDVGRIVKIHQAAFEDFFLTSLGEAFLELYYSTYIKSGLGVVYCAEKDDELVGFSACSYVSRGFNLKLIKQNLVKYGLESLRLLLNRPEAIIRLVKNLNKNGNGNKIKDSGDYAELYSIAVRPTYQGEGIGRLLLDATELDVRDHNPRLSLTTDYYENEKTLAFYRSLGYEVMYDFVAYPHRRMYRMIKRLR